MKLRRTKQQEESMRQETQRKLEEKRRADEQRKQQISEAVKRLEGHLKAGNPDLASLELEEVRKLDRRNPYIGAFEERIGYVRNEQEKKKVVPAAPPVEPPPAKEEETVGQSAPPALKPKDTREAHAAPKQDAAHPATSKAVSQGASKKPQILVIEDDPGTLLLIAHILNQSGYDATTLETSDEALVLLRRWVPDLIISDVNLSTSTMGGFTLYEKVRRLEHLDDVPYIVITSHADEKLQRIGKEMGIDEYLSKPVHKANLLAVVRGKLRRFGLRKKKG
jgi:CheY-like chemotaxis protein